MTSTEPGNAVSSSAGLIGSGPGRASVRIRRALWLDGHYAAAAFIRAAERIERGYSEAGTLAQAVQGSAYPYRYGQRAGQAAALNDKFCG